MKRAILLSLVLVPLMALAGESAQTTSTTPAAETSSATPTAAAPAEVKKDAKLPAKNPLANAIQARTPEEQAAQSGFQLATTLDHYLGMGTFYDAGHYSSLSAWLTIVPQYLFSIGKQRLVASATIRGSYEYTLPDDPTGRHWALFDTRLGLSAPALFREKALTNIAFSPSFGLAIPTSLESWNSGFITSVSLGLTASRSISTVDFRASVSGSRAFYGQPYSGLRNPNVSGTGPTPHDTNGNLLVVCRPKELYCAASNNNLAWSAALSGSIQWRATGSFLLYAGYTYIYSWKDAATTDPGDPYTPKALDANGNPVAQTGYGRGDRTLTYFGGSYQLNEHYSLDLGVSTIQTPLFVDKDGVQRVRFPFLSFGSWADNATSLYFTLTAAY